MEKFNRTLRGYDPEEVNTFLDKVINQVEDMLTQMKEKDDLLQKKDLQLQEKDMQIQKQEELIMQKNAEIERLNSSVEQNSASKDKLDQYVRMEDTLNRAILMAQKTSDQIKVTATRESELILDNAKKNATRIVNEALIRAEKTETEANNLRRNINIFKRRLRDIIEQQLESVEEIEKINF